MIYVQLFLLYIIVPDCCINNHPKLSSLNHLCCSQICSLDGLSGNSSFLLDSSTKCQLIWLEIQGWLEDYRFWDHLKSSLTHLSSGDAGCWLGPQLWMSSGNLLGLLIAYCLVSIQVIKTKYMAFLWSWRSHWITSVVLLVEAVTKFCLISKGGYLEATMWWEVC